LPSAKIDGAQARIWSSVKRCSLRSTRELFAKRVASVGVMFMVNLDGNAW
jgi:hypothetical protein